MKHKEMPQRKYWLVVSRHVEGPNAGDVLVCKVCYTKEQAEEFAPRCRDYAGLDPHWILECKVVSRKAVRS